TSSDLAAGLPADYTFVPADHGVHTFSATLNNSGDQALTATDLASGASGTQKGIHVGSPGVPAKLVISVPVGVTAGGAFSVTIMAEDLFGGPVLDYSGTVHISSSDSTSELPADYTFGDMDHGAHTFNVTLQTTGVQALMAADNGDGNVS